MYNNSLITLLCVTGLAACNGTTPQETTASGNAGFSTSTNLNAPGLLIQFNNNVSEQQALQVIAKQQSAIIRVLPSPGLYHIQIPSGMTAANAIQTMQGLPEVRFIEANSRRQPRS